jgi:hypothetical protein
MRLKFFRSEKKIWIPFFGFFTFDMGITKLQFFADFKNENLLVQIFFCHKGN